MVILLINIFWLFELVWMNSSFNFLLFIEYIDVVLLNWVELKLLLLILCIFILVLLGEVL